MNVKTQSALDDRVICVHFCENKVVGMALKLKTG